ncbi:MAG: hypothetical protein GKS00_13955 [Alphaproteobacteria bacterium]|nr:hypothetical protein [Alphaproteobacteria bacterium]
MCTLVLLRRSDNDWPLILAANRDEMLNRPSLAPARHWQDRPEVIAGKDKLSGGSWLGINDHGVVAAILNRTGSLGPVADKRSRGELVLEALDHADARDAAEALGDVDPNAYRTFNLVITDNRDAYWLAARDGSKRITVESIPEGISIFTSQDRNDPTKPRVAAYLPLFEAAAAPDPKSSDWSEWTRLMADRTGAAYDEPMCIVSDYGYGTVSSSLIALPQSAPGAAAQWRFAAGRPDITEYNAIDLGEPITAVLDS